MKALGNVRICDFTGQLAGAGATRFLAAFGAQVIRIEDPVNEGRWDILRNIGPFIDKVALRPYRHMTRLPFFVCQEYRDSRGHRALV